MKVIFLQNIRGMGQIGDIKNVADGYARNFLLPHKFAKLAVQMSVKEMEALKTKRELTLGQEEGRAKEIAGKLQDFTVKLSCKANEQGTLFAAVGAKDIAHRIKQDTGIDVEPDMVAVSGRHLKTLGEHTATINLARDVSVPVKVIVCNE